MLWTSRLGFSRPTPPASSPAASLPSAALPGRSPARTLALVGAPARREIERPQVSVILVCRDDEERIGHAARRIATHLDSLRLRHELIVVDELSGDNTLSLVALLRRELPSLKLIAGVLPGRGFQRGAEQALSPSLLLLDARSEAPLSAVGWALGRLATQDVVAVDGRYVTLHRTRALDAFDALHHRRDAGDLQDHLIRRARHLGLNAEIGATRAPDRAWAKLQRVLMLPLAVVARR